MIPIEIGKAVTINDIPLITRGAVDFKAAPTLAAGDVKISIDGGARANVLTLANASPANSTSVQLNLAAAETIGKIIGVTFIDQTGTKEWEDQRILFCTFGNASAFYSGNYNFIDVNTSTRLATTGYTAPDNASIGNVVAEVIARPRLTDIEASTVLAMASVLGNVRNEVLTLPTLAEIEASTILAKAQGLANISSQVAALGNGSGATLSQIEASTVLAMAAPLGNVKAEVLNRPTLSQIEASTVLAMASVLGNVKNEVLTLPTLTEIEASILGNVRNEVLTLPTLAQIEASTVLAMASNLRNVKSEVLTLSSTLGNVKSEVLTLPTLAEIEATTVLATASVLGNVKNEVLSLPTLTEIEATTILAKAAELGNVKSEVLALAVGSGASLAQIEASTILAKSQGLANISSQVAGITGGSTIINILPFAGSISPSYALSSAVVEIVSGDMVSVPYTLRANVTSKTIWFGAKGNVTDAGYAINTKEITSSVTAAGNGSGLIPLSVLETSLSAGIYKAELEVRNSSGWANTAITGMKFDIRIQPNII